MLVSLSTGDERVASAGQAAQAGLLSSLREMQALRGEWEALWRRCPAATPFQSPAWILSWAQHFAADRVRAVVIRRNDRLVALVPFFAWQGTLMLAGTGPTDYCDGLFAPEHEDCAAAALAALSAQADELACACVDMQQLRPGSPLLDATAPAGWVAQLQEGTVCPVSPLIGADGLGAVSKRWRRNLERARRQLCAQEGYDLREATAATIDEASRALEHLHARRWEQRGEAGVLADPLMRGFIRTVLPQLSAAGLLRFHRLHLGGEVAAVVFAMRAGRAAYYYLGGFDPDRARLSPGLVSVAAAMRDAAAAQAAEFHFLRGREAYKYHLGAADRPTFRRLLSRNAASCA